MDCAVAPANLYREIGNPVGAEGGAMHIGDMAQVQQIIDKKPPAAFDIKIIPDRNPVRIVIPVKIRDQSGIRLVRIAHPDPDPAVPFHHRPCPDRRTGRHLCLTRHRHTHPGSVINQPVIRTFDTAIDDFPHRKRHKAVRAAIFQRRDASVAVAEKHDGLIHDGTPQRAVIKLMRPSGDIPAVQQIRLCISHAGM